MILVLCDDQTLATFESPDHPPNWIEWIDVQNGEYVFSDDQGQLYTGQLVRPARLFKAEQWRLVPVGKPNPQNARALVNDAVEIDPDHCSFADLASLKSHLASGNG
jgi:hypothetical protein